MICTVTLNPALDCAMTFDTLTPGRTNRAGSQTLSPGGKGINVSRILHALGAETTALGFVAGSLGTLLEQLLAQAGVDTDFIRLPAGETRINVKVRAGEETELNGAGPTIPPQALDLFGDKLSRLHPGDTLVLSGSVPPSLPDTTYERLLSLLPAGVRTVVDAEGELLRKALPHRPFLIKPNLRELEGLCHTALSPTDQNAISTCAARLQEQGAQNVLVSLGPAGALLRTGEGRVLTCPAPQGRLVNSVGAGDSMVAGFLVGYDRGGPEEGLRLGIAAGSATAFSPSLATGEDIRRLYRSIS